MSLINREDLIAEYDRVHVGAPGGARKLMVDAPEVKPEPQWIPVSERLPEEGQQIIATVADNDLVDVFIIRGYFKKMHKSVIAWMPLPEPYREDGET